MSLISKKHGKSAEKLFMKMVAPAMRQGYTATADGNNMTGIPANILKVHTNELLFSAAPALKYDQFAVLKKDLIAQPGDTIVFSKYNNLARGGAIAEDSDVVIKSLSKTTVPIQVTEYMNAAGVTGKMLSLSFMDEMSIASISLGRDYARVTDDMLRDAVFSGTQVIYANKAANRNAVVNTLSLDDIDTAVEQMNTANVLKFADANGEFYICFVHPHQARALKNALNSIKQYAYPEMIFKGEIGEYNGVRFIETTNTPNGAADPTDSSYAAALNKAATGSLSTPFIYKAALISARAYGWAIAYEVELREDPSYSSFGRKRAIAYYTIQGAGKINNEEIIVIETA